MSDRNGKAPITAEELSAYMDGAMGPADRARFADRLSRDPEAAQRLAAFRLRDQMLRRGFTESEPPRPRNLLSLPIPTGRIRVRWALTVIGLVSAAAGLWSVLDMIHQHQALVALDSEGRAAYVLYARIPQDQSSERDVTAQSSAQLSAVVGLQVEPPDLNSLGLRLVGSRMLKQANGSAVVLVYGDGNGRTISCYFERSRSANETPYETSQSGAINAVYRIDDEIAYAVVGPFESQVLGAIAELSYREIEK